MEQFIYFIIGMIMVILIIKIVVPKPLIMKLNPNLSNYRDITYIDEHGKLYRYELSVL